MSKIYQFTINHDIGNCEECPLYMNSEEMCGLTDEIEVSDIQRPNDCPLRDYETIDSPTLRVRYIGSDVRCNSCRYWIQDARKCRKLSGIHEIGCGLWESK